MKPDLRNLARGKPCCARVAGVCKSRMDTVVLAHLPLPGIRGIGQKAPDLCGAYACYDCHRFIDGRDLTAPERRLRDEMRASGEWHEMLYTALMRTLALVQAVL